MDIDISDIDRSKIQAILDKRKDLGKDNKSWWEGYISGMADTQYITENEFDLLMDHLEE